MKIYFTISIILILFIQKIEAQIINYGLKGGADIVNGRFFKNETSWQETPRLSYDFGLLLSYNPFKFFQIQLESGFIEKGYTYEWAKVKFKHGYFNNQLVFILKPLKRLNIEFGPELNHLIYAKSIDKNRKTYNYKTSYYTETQLSGFVGLGFNFFYNDYIIIRYSYAFTPFIDIWKTPDSGPIYHYKVYEPYFSIGLRHYLRKLRS